MDYRLRGNAGELHPVWTTMVTTVEDKQGS
jgi:hypothetical protein